MLLGVNSAAMDSLRAFVAILLLPGAQVHFGLF